MCEESDSGIVRDLHQSAEWKSIYDQNGLFQGDPRGLSFGFCTDGMNPFSKEKVTYSMWPITISILNLPRPIRLTAGSMLLMGIIPGRSEPQNIDPYIDVLVDELLQLNNSRLYDSYRNEHFQLKVHILQHVLDYPGQNKVFHCQGKL